LCISTRAPRPPDPIFLQVCLLYFLNLPSLPVRFLGGAHTCHERWHLNRNLTTGELKALDKETLSEKRRHKTNKVSGRVN
jgi:hypothetical protein